MELTDYKLVNPAEISNFLEVNGDLIPILKEASEHIHKVFGECTLYLELDQYDWDELFIIIKTSLSPKDAVNKEIELFKEWFVNVMDITGKRLNYGEEPFGEGVDSI